MGNNTSRNSGKLVQFSAIEIEEPLLGMSDKARKSVSMMLHPIVKASI